MSNIWRSRDLPLINCKIELDLRWIRNYVISEISIIPRITGNPDTNPPVQEVAAIQTAGPTVQINNVKLYVPVVTLSVNDNIIFLENVKEDLKKQFLEQI